MSEAIVALGSNLGDRAANLRAALDLLAERGRGGGARLLSVGDAPPFPPTSPAT